MKTIISLLIFGLYFIRFLNAQDIIILKTGDEIKVKVLEITLDEVKYKMFNYLDGPVVSIFQKDVFVIKYENGTKDIFNVQKQVQLPRQQEVVLGDSAVIYQNGINDARVSYSGNGPMWGTIGASWFGLSIPSGLVTAVIVSSTPPSSDNFNMDYKMMNNTNYVRGYSDEAFKIKKKKTWKGFGIMLGIQSAAIIILFSTLSSMNNY